MSLIWRRWGRTLRAGGAQIMKIVTKDAFYLLLLQRMRHQKASITPWNALFCVNQVANCVNRVANCVNRVTKCVNCAHNGSIASQNASIASQNASIASRIASISCILRQLRHEMRQSRRELRQMRILHHHDCVNYVTKCVNIQRDLWRHTMTQHWPLTSCIFSVTSSQRDVTSLEGSDDRRHDDILAVLLLDENVITDLPVNVFQDLPSWILLLLNINLLREIRGGVLATRAIWHIYLHIARIDCQNYNTMVLFLSKFESLDLQQDKSQILPAETFRTSRRHWIAHVI